MSRVADRLFLTDAEIAARIPMTTEEWRAAARALERYGLPRPDPLFGGRRCWPRVYAFLCGWEDSRVRPTAPQTASGEPVFLEGEVPHGFRYIGRRRAGAQGQAK